MDTVYYSYFEVLVTFDPYEQPSDANSVQSDAAHFTTLFANAPPLWYCMYDTPSKYETNRSINESINITTAQERYQPTVSKSFSQTVIHGPS